MALWCGMPKLCWCIQIQLTLFLFLFFVDGGIDGNLGRGRLKGGRWTFVQRILHHHLLWERANKLQPIYGVLGKPFAFLLLPFL